MTHVTSLPDFSVLRFSGEKTQAFLQGQLTCDMRLLSKQGDYSLAACCDHRGRMIANFWVVKWHKDFLFILPRTMVDIVKNHLQKYAVFSKVTLTADDYDDTFSFILDKNTWHQKNIESDVCFLQPKTSLLFTPQMINLDKQGGVSFDKGCYVGQEIVARTEHLGTLKRHLHRLQITNDTPLTAGDPLFKDTVEIGTIVDVVTIGENHYDILAVIEDRYC